LFYIKIFFLEDKKKNTRGAFLVNEKYEKIWIAGRQQMDQKFIREKKELAYHAHIFDVYNDYLRLPDGKHVVYDLVDHVDGCCVLPVDEDGNLILVSQYRNAVDDITLEVPAGCMDEGEDPGQCAVRELEEETGYIAQELQFVTKTYLAIGTSNEQTYIYIATDLKKGIRQPDPEEFIRIRRIPLAEAMTMIQAGEIVDSKTIIAILAYAVGQMK